jgi:histidyl-tRNA synthetase
MNPNLKMPFKRYELGPVFRDGPIKLGRYRQFGQCDIDVVGCKDMVIDAEIVALTLDCFKALELDAYIEVNTRKLLRGIIKWAGIKPELADSVIISIDKLAKFGKDEVVKELEQKKIEDTKIAKLLSAFDVKGTNEEKIEMLKGTINNKEGKEGLKEMEEIFSYLSDEQKKNVIFNVALARGLGYYTGPVFEGFLRKSKIKSSICGGGRYDNMIPTLLGTKKAYPTVGISFGLDVITDAMKLSKKVMDKTVTQIYVIPIKTQKECFAICKKLRDMGVKADMDMLGRGISKNLQYADSMKIPYVIFAGDNELKQNKVKLRNMESGEEKLVKVKDVLANL